MRGSSLSQTSEFPILTLPSDFDDCGLPTVNADARHLGEMCKSNFRMVTSGHASERKMHRRMCAVTV